MQKAKDAILLTIGVSLPLIFLLALGVFLVGCGGGGSSGGGKSNDDDDGDNVIVPPVAPAMTTHEKAFTETLPAGYEGAHSCLVCHVDAGSEMLASGHWTWEGVSENLVGLEGEVHGKTDFINNFCIAVPSNEPRCTQCHAGIGWKDQSFDFGSTGAMDCLVCHDTTGLYKKAKKTAGAPDPAVDLQAVAMAAGMPSRKNCGACHFNAGGGDNVKHGDLSSHLVSPTRQMDVHMDASGLNFTCQKCHETTHHAIAGMPIHSTQAGRNSCEDCHDAGSVHEYGVLNDHTARLACQACHVPAIARSMPTKMEWYWDEAGQDVSPIPTDQYGKPTYNKLKGRFVWGMNVRPVLRWFNGKWKHKVIGANDKWEQLPAVMAEPVGSRDDPTAKLYPFKMMIGRQAADKNNRTILVPHLFGTDPGPNPYWGKFDWDAALAEGAAWAGQSYTGEFEFIDTVMYLSVNHEVAPKEQALSCDDCHGGGLDFASLGYPEYK